MLRVAVPNKGVLSEAAISMLKEAGYVVRRDPKDLHVIDKTAGIAFFYLRPRDIATYVGSGSLDAGFTGMDLLVDSQSSAKSIASLGFGASTLRFAGPIGRFLDVAELEGRSVATAYPNLVKNYLQTKGVNAKVITLDGAVEVAVRLGVAEAVADVVSTGSTLRQAGLEVFGPVILESEAQLIVALGKDSACEGLLQRLEGVRVAREYVIFDYDCPIDLVEAASKVTPGIESPTISPLRDQNWVAIRSLVKAAETNEKMDELYKLGARAILVSAIHAARI
jgi:ATP phosphoribosyltransferase